MNLKNDNYKNHSQSFLLIEMGQLKSYIEELEYNIKILTEELEKTKKNLELSNNVPTFTKRKFNKTKKHENRIYSE